jgi:hypothetical protein
MFQGSAGTRSIGKLGELFHPELDAFEGTCIDEVDLRSRQPASAHGSNLTVFVVDRGDSDVVAHRILDAFPVLKLRDTSV